MTPELDYDPTLCADGTPDEDHDWKISHDWAGDPEVIGGTYNIVTKECQRCGKQAEPTEADYAGDYFDDNYI